MDGMSEFEILHQARIVQEVLAEDYGCSNEVRDFVECMLLGAGKQFLARGIPVWEFYILPYEVQGAQVIFFRAGKKHMKLRVPA